MKFYTNVAVIGSSVFVREVVDGNVSKRRDLWQPTLYTKGKPNGPTDKFKTLFGEEVWAVKPGSIPECRDFIKQYEGVNGFDIYGQTNFALQYMNEYRPSSWDYKHISTWAIDIETEVPEDDRGKTSFPIPKTCLAEVLLITMVDMHSGHRFTFGRKEYEGQDTQYTLCENEHTLLKQFVLFWEQRGVDIITGWNIAQFDLPYLISRITAILGAEWAKRLSPWGRVACTDREFKKKLEYDVSIVGVSVLDYMVLYKKYMPVRQESYALEHIANVELGHTKIDHSEYATFNEFWRKDWEKFTQYNIVDTVLVKELDDKLKLLRVVLTMAYEAKINYEDVSSPVKLWDAIICNYLLDDGIVVPQQEPVKSAPHLDGAYVKEPVPGFYNNVVSIDATSLYPSEIITNNISPETYVGNCGFTIDDFLAGKKPDVDPQLIVTPCGAVYRKDIVGVLPKVVMKYMAMRKDSKTEMLALEQEYETTRDPTLKSRISALDNLQYAIKIAMNSLYGATANKFFRFYKHDHAASITLSGQYHLRTLEYNIDKALNEVFKTRGEKYLIYIDTDSLYFNLDPVVKKYKVPKDLVIKAIEKLTIEKINPAVNGFVEQCCANMRSLDNRIFFKLEVAADKALWVGKKMYSLRVHSSEGVTYKEPKIKAKGLDMVKSSTPRVVRDKLKKALEIIFEGDEKALQRFVSQVREEFMGWNYKQIAFPRGVNNLDEYSHPTQIFISKQDGSCPIQVRGSLLYNHYLMAGELDGKYPLIGDSDKIRFIYLKLPNRIKQNVIAFPVDGIIPKEFGLENAIDYETQFEKTFLNSVDTIMEAIGWSSVEVSSLEEFFA